jgi:Tol biopolymer transport system component
MSDKRYDVLDRFSPLFETPDLSIQGFLRRRERKRRNQRIAAGVVGIAIFVVPLLVFAVLISPDRTGTPAGTGPITPPASSDVPNVDYVLDLGTGKMTPLPFIRDVGGSALNGQYAPSPNGSLFAFVGVKDNGSRQIFIARVGGKDRRQLTHLPRYASPSSTAWSPDGTKIAYIASDSADVRHIFVVEVATGRAAQVTDEPAIQPYAGLQFTPDGSSILFTGGSNAEAELRTVPVSGGKSTLLFDPQARGFGYTGGGSLSSDGSLVTFMGHRIGGPGAIRFVANEDGTNWRAVGSCISNPAGTWSPDGSRIVCGPNGPPPGIRVIDIATGDVTTVSEGLEAIWLDNQTLLVETDPTL